MCPLLTFALKYLYLYKETLISRNIMIRVKKHV